MSAVAKTARRLIKKVDRGTTSSCWRRWGRSPTDGHTCRARSGSRTQAGSPSSYKSAEIVAYCSNFNRHSSTRVVRDLTAMGYKNVYEYEGGKQDWIGAGYPTESGG